MKLNELISLVSFNSSAKSAEADIPFRSIAFALSPPSPNTFCGWLRWDLGEAKRKNNSAKTDFAGLSAFIRGLTSAVFGRRRIKP